MSTRSLEQDEILRIMPQQPPFLFVQSAILHPSEGWASGSYHIDGNEDLLRGHFRHGPVFPASVLLEALGQLGVLFLLDGSHKGVKRKVNPEAVFFTSCNGVRCFRICRPGDTLTLGIRIKRIRHPIVVFEGTIHCGEEKAAVAEELTLIFDYEAAAPEAEVC